MINTDFPIVFILSVLIFLHYDKVYIKQSHTLPDR